MKYLAVFPLVLAASCASHPQLVLRPASQLDVEPIDAVRYSELIRAYHIGRYVDPSQPETMHEQHPVYRVETSARWNLHPGNTANLLNPPRDAAYSPSPTNDAVLAELNRQKETTERVMHEATRLAQSYAELQQVFGEMKNVARNNAGMNVRLASTEERLAAIAQQLHKLAAPIPQPPTNDVPAFIPEPQKDTLSERAVPLR